MPGGHLLSAPHGLQKRSSVKLVLAKRFVFSVVIPASFSAMLRLIAPSWTSTCAAWPARLWMRASWPFTASHRNPHAALSCRWLFSAFSTFLAISLSWLVST